MDYGEFTEQLKNIILPVLQEEDVLLVELNFTRTRGNILVRVFVDRKEGGISLGDCVGLNEKIGDVLDKNDIFKERYVLEVSSPGLDRSLTAKNDFLRSLNRNVKFFLKEAISGKIEFDGKVVNAEDAFVTVETKEGILQIPLENIRKGKQIF